MKVTIQCYFPYFLSAFRIYRYFFLFVLPILFHVPRWIIIAIEDDILIWREIYENNKWNDKKLFFLFVSFLMADVNTCIEIQNIWHRCRRHMSSRNKNKQLEIDNGEWSECEKNACVNVSVAQCKFVQFKTDVKTKNRTSRILLSFYLEFFSFFRSHLSSFVINFPLNVIPSTTVCHFSSFSAEDRFLSDIFLFVVL